MTAETQGSPEWHMRRLAKVTGSRVFSVVDFDARGKPRAAYNRLLDELEQEFKSQQPTANYTSQAMKDGTRKEPIARTLFMLQHDVDVREVGFEDHPNIDHAGVSLDGIIDTENALIEIKCPLINNHTLYWEDERIPPKYLCQMYWGMACYPQLTHGYFISYNETAETGKHLLVRRVERNQKRIDLMEERVTEFVELLKSRF